MAIVFTGRASTGNSSTNNISLTHGLTINNGDLVVAFINGNGTGGAIGLQGASGGGTWVEHTEATYATARRAIQYVIANGSEPSAYTWTMGVTDRNSVVISVFSGVDNTTPVDIGFSKNTGTSTSAATADITVANGAVAVAMVGMDGNTGTIDSVNNSFIELETITPQPSGIAHRIFASGGATGVTTFTLSSSIAWNTDIMSFAEAIGGGSVPAIMINRQQQE